MTNSAPGRIAPLSTPTSRPAPGASAVPLLIGFVVVYLSVLGYGPLVEPDEPRYAEIAREMVERGDWVTPHLNYVKYFEKPPLVYWLTAVNISALGTHEFAVRLWPALFALIGIGATCWLGCQIGGPAVGVLAALVLATAPLYFGIGQVLILDMPLTGLLALAMAFGWAIARREERNRAAEVGFAITLAFAVLTKGPVALVLAGGSLLVYSFLTRRWFWWIRLLRPLPVAVFLVVSAPWFLLVSLRNPEFVQFFFVEQHVGRYVAPTEHRQPFWFFLPVVFAGFLPWSWVVAVDVVRAGLQSSESRPEESRLGNSYLAGWVVFSFLFFSFSGSKLATYILPIFPPLAVWVAQQIEALLRREDAVPWQYGSWLLILLGLGTLAASRLAPLLSTHMRAYAIVPYLLAGGLVLTAGGLAAGWFSRRKDTGKACLAMWVTTLALCVVVFSGRGIAEHYTPLAQTIREHWQPGDRIVLLGHYTQGIPYYTGQRVIMVRAWGELDFGSRQGEQSAFFWPHEEQLLAAWQEEGRMFLVLNDPDLRRLSHRLKPAPRVLARWGKKVLVTNFE